MKREISIAQPAYLVEDWPGKYDVFSWLEYIVTVPNPIFFVTTRKPNGAPNANHDIMEISGRRIGMPSRVEDIFGQPGHEKAGD
jgi:hypothetical protein